MTVVARSAESRSRAEHHGADTIVGDVGGLPAVAAFYIASTIASHASVIESVIDRGVPVFCEKPLTGDAASARSLAQRAGGRLFVLDKWRYHPGIVEIARIARSGELGPIVGLSTRRLGWGNAHPDATATWVLGPHDLSIGLEVLGRVLPLRSAVADSLDGRLSGWLAHLADASAWQAIEISERSTDRKRSVRVLCRDGGLDLADTFADHVAVWRLPVGVTSGPLDVERRPISTEWPLRLMLADTLRFLDGGPAPKTPARDAVAVVERLAEIEAACGGASPSP